MTIFNTNRNQGFLYIRFFTVFIFTITSLNAQFDYYEIIGQETNVIPLPGNNYSYSVVPVGSTSPVNFPITWEVFDGTILTYGTNSDYLENGPSTIDINFMESEEAQIIAYYYDEDFGEAFILYELLVYPEDLDDSIPNRPTLKDITENCGVTILERNVPTESNVTWYWQTSNTGKSISDTSIKKEMTSGTRYYLRARNDNFPHNWSDALPVDYDIRAVPAKPTGTNPNSLCGAGEVTFSAVPGNNGTSIKWYDSATGGNELHTGLTYTTNVTATNNVTATKTVYAATWNSDSKCPSSPSDRLAITATVLPALNAGSITGANTVCYGQNPVVLNNQSTASGCNGSYTYQWEQKIDGSSTWVTISGATTTSYDPPSLTRTTAYRRKVTANGYSAYTNQVQITVRPELIAGTINNVSPICYNENPGILQNGTAPSGGDNNYVFQWQYSNNSSSGWSNINGATSLSYDPPAGLTSSRWYRRNVVSCNQTKSTFPIQITVNPLIDTPLLTLLNQPGCGAPVGSFSINGFDSNEYSYEITPSNGTSILENGTVLAPPGIYTVTKNANGCSSSPSNVLEINEPPSIPNATSLTLLDQPTCDSPTGTFRINGYNPELYSYNVSPNNGIAIAGNGTVTAPPNNYTVSVSANGCSSSQSNEVVINAPPSAPNAPTLTLVQQTSCTVVTGSFRINGYNPTVYTYNVSPSTGIAIAGDGTVTAPANSYTVSLSANGCTSGPSNEVEINVPPSTPDAPTLTLLDQPSCDSAIGSFSINGFDSDLYNYEITPSTGTSIIENGTILAPPGTYTVRVIANGCSSAPSDQVVINVPSSAPETPTFTLLDQPSCEIATGSFIINDYTPTIYTYNVSPNAGIAIAEDGTVTAPAGTYNITASSGVCSSTAASIQLNSASDCDPDPDPSVFDPTDQNYVYSRTYQSARETPPNFFTADDDDLIQNITYFDGLGRPMQQNAIAHSPDNRKDIITHIGYDDYGRMEKEWLPVLAPDSDLATYRTIDMEETTRNYYKNPQNYGSDFPNLTGVAVNPYSEKFFEPSPLNRVLKQAAPGEDWKLNRTGEDNTIEFAYETNEANEVRLFKVNFINDNTEQPELATDNFYEAGQLYKNITRDENHSGTTKNHTTEEFTDKQGRVVLKRTFADVNANVSFVSEQEAHDTYYVYDDYGNLSYVLPPKMEATSNDLATLQTNMDALGYRYVYDYRNRLIEKQIPGKLEEYIVYNKLDQPIMTQDANQRAKGEWLFTKYDAFGRVAYTGIATLGSLATVKTGVESSSEPLWVTQTGTSTSFGGVTDGVFYTSNTYPNTNTEILTINYYDNYDARPTSFPTSVSLLDSESNDNNTINVKGLPTVSKVKVLENDAWITSLSYYDEKGRAVYSYSENSYLNTVDITETALDFVGKPLKTRTEHRRDLDPAVSGDEVIVVTIDNFTYDHVGRLLSQTQCTGDATMGDSCDGTTIDTDLEITSGTITTDQVASNSITITNATIVPDTRIYINANSGNGGKEELIVFNSYDELGQLQAKKVGGTPEDAYDTTQGLQTVDYTYNIRGWLKTINDDLNNDNDLFNFSLNYNDPTGLATALYNGNISEAHWQTANEDATQKGYGYQYDALNRILAATGGANTNYDVFGITYDKNGNIGKLNRRGNDAVSPTSPNYGVIDNLDYQYDSGNKLLSVTDTATNAFANEGFKDGNPSGIDYLYDANGNMTQDLNKGIKGATPTEKGIVYNHLNLPVTVTIDDGGANNGTISYIYDATGVKLQKNVLKNGEMTPTPTDYVGNYIYENNKLQFFSTPEGYVEPKNPDNLSQGYYYVYQYKDHLGNVRLSYTDANNDGQIDASSEIIEENNYYPFGLEHKGYNNVVNGTENNYFNFNGKELNKELGLEWLDFGARNYDAALGRWMNIDPLAGQMRRHSPYNYAFDNPIYFIDPDGMAPTDWYLNKKTNEVVWMDGNKNYKGYENLGHFVTYTDVDSNVTFLDGDNQTISYNGEVIESFKTTDVAGVIDYALDNIASPIMEGAQILGYTVFGTGVMFGEMLKDISNGGDGTNLKVDMEMPMAEFKDGNLVQTDLNDYSDGEIITSGISATGLTVGGNTGMGAVANWLESVAAKAAAKKMVEEVTEEE